MSKPFFIAIFLIMMSFYGLKAQDTESTKKASFRFKGQLSGWAHYNPSNELPIYLGGRFIPQVNMNLPLRKNRLLDIEASANIPGSIGFQPFDTAHATGQINPYRVWARYSTRQFELRVGLQKINFGSATLLRPLRWFDHVDPRDPLQLTSGVWGVSGKYYFLNNINIWAWILYRNHDAKGWEVLPTSNHQPELGGRVQLPIHIGDIGFSYHHRLVDIPESPYQTEKTTPENRYGFDARIDAAVGLWTEASWVSKTEDLGSLTNQESIATGIDYTFEVGNGLYLLVEHLITSFDEKAFQFSQTVNFTGVTTSYPVGMFDNLQTIFYYDWENQSVYNFINWSKQYDTLTFYIMAYWNPKTYKLPLQNGAQNLYAGKGIQLMIVYDF